MSFFLNFFCKKVRNTTGTKFFWRFLILCEKCVINRKRSNFFFVFKKKTSNWTPVWGGGEEKFIFQNQLFGLLVVKSKVDFFRNPYGGLRVKHMSERQFRYERQVSISISCEIRQSVYSFYASRVNFYTDFVQTTVY